jgi:hypothetical protein
MLSINLKKTRNFKKAGSRHDIKFEFIVTSRRERASRRIAVATCMVWLRMAQV